nr:hypothetical protein [Tanacetum cinerariifolium]
MILAAQSEAFKEENATAKMLRGLDQLMERKEDGGRVADIAQPREDFKKLLMKEYYPDDEIQKLESEFWNHKMVGLDIDGYTARFHELARLVPHVVTLENQCVNRYIRGLAPKIKENVTSSRPTTIQSVVSMANYLTTDGIKDGSFKKKENDGNKKRLNDQFKNKGRNYTKLETADQKKLCYNRSGSRTSATSVCWSTSEVCKMQLPSFWYVVDSNGIHVHPSKNKVAKNWKALKTPSEIRSFLGLAGYYRRFIENLCNAPILSLPDEVEEFVVYCDTSNQAQSEAFKEENATAKMLRGLDQLMERKEDGVFWNKLDGYAYPVLEWIRWVRLPSIRIDRMGTLPSVGMDWMGTLPSIGMDRMADIAQPREDFKKLLMKEYYPDDEIQKLESEFWNHKMVGLDIDGYTARFHELARLVPHVVTLENQCVNRYIRGLAPKIKENVTSSRPTTIQSVVSMANYLTTDGIKDGSFKKKENDGNKKRLNDQFKNKGRNYTKLETADQKKLCYNRSGSRTSATSVCWSTSEVCKMQLPSFWRFNKTSFHGDLTSIQYKAIYQPLVQGKLAIPRQGELTVFQGKERKCKLYDAFDKFAHIKGELLHQYCMTFTQQINDMNIYNMKLEQFQVNTKFLNSLPPEWSTFVTDVKLVNYLYTTNFDQLYAYLEQHELYANERRMKRTLKEDPAYYPANRGNNDDDESFIDDDDDDDVEKDEEDKEEEEDPAYYPANGGNNDDDESSIDDDDDDDVEKDEEDKEEEEH